MERTNKKLLGFAVLATVAIAVALMFSYFANAVSLEDQQVEAVPVAAPVVAESDATLTINAMQEKDPFGNDSYLVYHFIDGADPTKEVTDTKELKLDKIDGDDKYAFYYGSSSSTSTVTTPSATLYIWDTEAQWKAFIDAGSETSTSYKYKITFSVTDTRKSLVDKSSKVWMYWVDKEGDLISQKSDMAESYSQIKWDEQGDVRVEKVSDLPSTIAFFFENNCGDLYFDLDGAQLFGQQLPLAHWVKEYSGGYLESVEKVTDIHLGSNIEVNAADNEVIITDYDWYWDAATAKPVIFPHTYTFKLDFLTGGAEVNAFFAYSDTAARILDNEFKFTRDDYEITFFASIDLIVYSIDGVQYKVMTLDKLKGIVDELAQEIDPEGPYAKYYAYIKAAQYVLNSLPSTFAAVSGLDADCPTDIVIPDVITSQYEGYKFPVCAVLTDALSSNTVKNITFPYTMKALFADSCTGLKNLESVTFEDSGVAFLPNMEKFINFKVTVHSKDDPTQYKELTSTQIITVALAYARGIITEWPFAESGPQLLGTYVKNELQNESAFNASLLASVQDPMSQDIAPYMCNDNPLYHSILPSGEWNLMPTKNIRGTFKLCPDAQAVGERKVMFGTGTFSSVILDRVTGQPVINAKVIFSDEFGNIHVTYTNSVGAFTIDDLYQTAAFLYDFPEFLFHFRKFTVEANDYVTINVDEGDEPGNADSDTFGPRWSRIIGCYTYYNPLQTSNMVYENGFPMQRESATCYIASACNLGYVADVAAGSTVSGANVQIYQLNESGAQKFVFEPAFNDEGEFIGLTIKNAQSGKYLDVTGGVAANYTNVQQYDGNGTAAQLWIPEIDGEFVILHSAINENYVLDLNAADANNGQNLQLFEANGTAAQKFHLLSVVPAIPAGDFDLADGTYVIRTGVNPENVLDVQWGSADDGANVWAYTYAKGNTNQMWEVTQVAWGYYTLKNVNTGKYLDVAGCGITPGTNVWQYSENGTTAQLWSISKVEENGATFYKLVNVGTGLALDIAGANTASEANVQGYFDNGTNAQHFAFQPVVK